MTDPTDIDYDEHEMREQDLDDEVPDREDWIENDGAGWDGDEHIHEPETEREQDEYAFSRYEA